MEMLRKLLRMPPKPAKLGESVNNVLHIERVRRAHFVNAASRAIRAAQLNAAHESRAKHHADAVWRKHLDRVPGYQSQREAEKAVLDYIDLLTKYQRNDQRPAAPWSPSFMPPKGAA